MTSKSSLGLAAIVTGAGQGIGRTIAFRLAQDGYDVTVSDLESNALALESLVEEIKGTGRKALALIADVRQENEVQMLVDQTVAEFGELYVMVANAGIGNPLATVVDLSFDDWNNILSVNLTGVFLCYKAAARQMLKQGRGGRIIGASSTFGKRGQATLPAYSATKFGVRGLTQALASELITKGITVNAYAPGFIDTPLMSSVDKVVTAAEGTPVGSWTQAMTELVPIGRLGRPEEVAGLVSYIVSDDAGFMTGQSVSLNGGMFYD